MTWLLTSCPRCNGNLYRETEGIACLQCGATFHNKAWLEKMHMSRISEKEPHIAKANIHACSTQSLV